MPRRLIPFKEFVKLLAETSRAEFAEDPATKVSSAAQVDEMKACLLDHYRGVTVPPVECGWQVYPDKYKNNKPCLFIYWTADGYNKTGNYNLDKKAFVQTNSAWTLGGALSPVSTYNEPQYELEFSWYLYQGNWWLYLKGTTASNAIGYYPTSLFGGGQLATCALDIDYGGETAGTTPWPPTGSGHFPAEGFGKAAYQRNIYYFPVAGGGTSAALTGSQPSPSCYKISLSSNGTWNPYFYFGGAGC